jgi:hypothetical protein
MEAEGLSELTEATNYIQSEHKNINKHFRNINFKYTWFSTDVNSWTWFQ